MTDEKHPFDLRVFIEERAREQGRPLHPLGLAGRCPECPECISGQAIMVEAGWGVSARLRRVLVRGLRPHEADEIAVAVGKHPSHYWPDWCAHVPPLDLDEAS